MIEIVIEPDFDFACGRFTPTTSSSGIVPNYELMADGEQQQTNHDQSKRVPIPAKRATLLPKK